MSAFIVSDSTIAGILQAAGFGHYGDRAAYYFNGGRKEIGSDKPGCSIQSIGQCLLDENYRSVNSRYCEASKPHVYVHKSTPQLAPVEIIKQCDCLSYQSCETNDWADSEAHAIL